MSAALVTKAAGKYNLVARCIGGPLAGDILTASRGAGPPDGHIYTCLSVAGYGRMFVQHGSIDGNFYEVKMWNM